jgi:phosphatidylinositol 4-phosphatase
MIIIIFTSIFKKCLYSMSINCFLGKGVGQQQKSETENDCDLIENPLYTSKIEPQEKEQLFQPSTIVTDHTEKQSLKTPSNINKFNPFNADSKTPEIQVESEGAKAAPPSTLVLSQKLSHSSSDITYDEPEGVNYHRSNSQHEIALNIAQSHSESALKQLKNIASPVSSATREMVLSPLSKLAKGVQTLGANLDPRKIKVSYISNF